MTSQETDRLVMRRTGKGHLVQLLFAVVVVCAVLFVYRNSFQAPFLLDDLVSITHSSSIQSLRPTLDTVSGRLGGSTVAGRPLVNYSLAVNYALGGYSVSGYHVFNVAVHVLCSLVLMVVVGLLLGRTKFGEGGGAAFRSGAFAVALLWALHPLASLPVVYIIQRAELMASLFYLLTVYCHLKSHGSATAGRWNAASVAFCCLGAASKEIIATAPVAVILIDRAFVHGSFRECFRRERRYYLGFLLPLALLGGLMISSAGRGGTAGFGVPITWLGWVRSQFVAVARYLRLSLWPDQLVFDYGGLNALEGVTVWPYAALVLGLVGVTLLGVAKNSKAGAVAFCFFLVLAPTSSVMPISETMAEHRMYLALCVPVALVFGGLAALAGRFASPGRAVAVAALFPLLLAPVAGVATHARLGDFSSALSIWTDTVNKWPGRARSHAALGGALAEAGRMREAVTEYENALTINPNFTEAMTPYSYLLLKLGRTSEAVETARRAAAAKPDWDWAQLTLGAALMESGDLTGGEAAFLRAVELNPGFADGYNHLGIISERKRDARAALVWYDRANEVEPLYYPAYVNRAKLLLRLGELDRSARDMEKALELSPGALDVAVNLGGVRMAQGRYGEALAVFSALVGSHPEQAEFHEMTGDALSALGRRGEAAARYETALKLNPALESAKIKLTR